MARRRLEETRSIMAGIAEPIIVNVVERIIDAVEDKVEDIVEHVKEKRAAKKK